jgi:hypothetical protein
MRIQFVPVPGERDGLGPEEEDVVEEKAAHRLSTDECVGGLHVNERVEVYDAGALRVADEDDCLDRIDCGVGVRALVSGAEDHEMVRAVREVVLNVSGDGLDRREGEELEGEPSLNWN